MTIARCATLCLALTSCATNLPAPGTPEAARACESLRLNVESVDRYYPDSDGVDFDNDLARASFLMQAAEYSAELKCTNIELHEFAPLPEEMVP